MLDELKSKITNLVTSESTTESDIDHLMTLIRKIQERPTNKSKKYLLLDFFCDWTKHTTLNWNPEANKIIIDLNEQLYSHKSENTHLLIENISNIISFERLQTEFRQFLMDYELPLDIVNKKDLWLRFVVLLINIVSECSLSLKDKKSNTIRHSIVEGVHAHSLRYSWIEMKLFFPKAKVKGEKCLALIISFTDTSTLIMPCKVQGSFIKSKAQ